MSARLDNPYLGGQPLVEAPSGECKDIPTAETGDVQHIDIRALQSCAEELDTRIYVRCLPGSFVTRGDVLLSVEAASVADDKEDEMRRAVTIGSRRTFEEDPRFGLIVLTEIASKELSPAVNDPGTATALMCWTGCG